MSGQLWRGNWYIYNHRRGEFLIRAARSGNRCQRNPDRVEARWSPSIRQAQAYKNQHLAAKTVARLNAQLDDGRPVSVCSVVTHIAAQVLDEINARDRAREASREAAAL